MRQTISYTDSSQIEIYIACRLVSFGLARELSRTTQYFALGAIAIVGEKVRLAVRDIALMGEDSTPRIEGMVKGVIHQVGYVTHIYVRISENDR